MNQRSNAETNSWVGRSDERHDVITAGPIWGFYDVLDESTPEPKLGDAIPAGAHWCFFLPHVPMSEVGADGHPKRGGFMPDPIGLPRRMFAGSRLTFPDSLHIGDVVTRRQEITSVTPKSGNSGRLLFVTVREEYSTSRGTAITQENDIVYREPPPPDSQPIVASDRFPIKATWSNLIQPSPVMLFKYSAITFNGHRIHYDRSYAIDEEGYPGLVVHGPLTATFLMNLCRREKPNSTLREFSFRAIAPLYDTGPFSTNATTVDDNPNHWTMWAANIQGGVCMKAKATFFC